MHAQPIATCSPCGLLYGYTRRRKCDIKQLRLSSDNHSAISSELEIGSCCASVNLTNEFAGRIENMNTIATTSVDTADRVSVNTYTESDFEIGLLKQNTNHRG